jgi:hypothetical protein
MFSKNQVFDIERYLYVCYAISVGKSHMSWEWHKTNQKWHGQIELQLKHTSILTEKINIKKEIVVFHYNFYLFNVWKVVEEWIVSNGRLDWLVGKWLRMNVVFFKVNFLI